MNDQVDGVITYLLAGLMRKISGVEWGKVLQELLALSLAILICISGIYAVPYGEIPSDSVVEVKRAFYMLAMALMAIHLMRCGSSGLHKLFSVSCVLLMLIFLMNAVIRQETFLESVYNAVSISFVWLFVGSIQGSKFPYDRFCRYLRIGVFAVDFFAFLAVLLCLAGVREISHLVATGFHGNRVKFSIWLAQFVFLNFFLFRESFRKSLPFVASCILLVLQAFTGGRLGVLMTLAAMLYFLPQIVRGWFGRAVAGLGILILAVLADNYSPTKYLTDNASIFRGLTEWQAAPDLLTYLDRISAHRIQIMITALQSIRVEDLLFGKGAGHFDVSVDGRFWMVHNVFLKMLGEFGVMAFVFQLMIVVLPFSSAFRRMSAGSELHLLWLIGIMIGSLQPRYLLTGLSDCLVVWLCYALIFRWANQGNSKEIEIDMAGATRKILPA